MSATPKLPQAEYRRLGNSGLRVSVPILGCMSFGSKKATPFALEEEEALPILKAAWDRGVTTWDMANGYSNGETERIVGKALKKYNIPRHRVVILTRHIFMVPDTMEENVFDPTLKTRREYVNEWGLSRAALFRQVDASLARLGTDYIDLFSIGRVDLDNVSAEETMKALHDLVQSGKIRYIGASSMWTWQFAHYNHVAEKNGWTKFVSMENYYNLLYREEEREMVKYCNFAGIGMIAYFALGAGKLARPLGSDTTARSQGMSRAMPWFANPEKSENEIRRRVEKVAKDKGWTMTQVSLAWLNARVTSPLVGVTTVERLDEAIIPGFTLTEDESKYLEEPYVPLAVRMVL